MELTSFSSAGFSIFFKAAELVAEKTTFTIPLSISCCGNVTKYLSFEITVANSPARLANLLRLASLMSNPKNSFSRSIITLGILEKGVSFYTSYLSWRKLTNFNLI